MRNDGAIVRLRSVILSRQTSVAIALAIGLLADDTASAQSVPPARPTPTNAAPDANSADDIIVTARKRDERLQDVPGAVTALDTEVIAKANIARIDDLRRLAPNVNIVTGEDQAPDVTLRGVGSFGVVQAVGFYVDDVQQFEGQTARLEDIERIEILRGPQGTLYGGSNIGGAIKYVTRRPSRDLTGQVSIEGGSRNTINIAGVISGPIAGNLLGRLTVYDDRRDGYIFDTTLNHRVGDSRTQGFRLALEDDFGATSVRFSLNGTKEDSNGYVMLYRAASDQAVSRTIDSNFSPFFRRRLLSPALTITHDLGFADLTSISSYFYSKREGAADIDFTAANIQSADRIETQNNYSQEVRLTSSGNGVFKWLIGGFAQRRDVDGQSFVTIVPAHLFIATPTTGRIEQYAAFTNVTYDIGKLTIEGGARLELDRNYLRDDATGANGVQSDTAFLPRASLRYKFSRNLTAYASVTRGFTPGGVLDERRITTHSSEQTTNYEAGLKGSLFDRAVSFELAGFYISYNDRLFKEKIIVPGLGLVDNTRNIGSSRNYGLEFSTSVRAGREVILTGGLGITDAKWGKAFVNDAVTGNPNLNLDGKDVPFTPSYQGNLSADWTHKVSDDLQFGARADILLTGRQWWDLSNTHQQRAYQLVNLGARIGYRNWELSAQITNVFNKAYNTQFFDGPTVGTAFDLAQPAAPRGWTLKLLARL